MVERTPAGATVDVAGVGSTDASQAGDNDGFCSIAICDASALLLRRPETIVVANGK
jgi:hypothetical protein